MLEVLGADSEPLKGVGLAIQAHMPDHGHMSPTTPEANPTDAQGRTDISGLDLFMAGVWVVDVSIMAADTGEPMASVSFTFCVEG